MRILLSAYACRPNAGSEPGVGWNWATHLAARGIDVHVLVAKRNQEAIEAGLRTAVISNLHFTFVAVPYKWPKQSEASHYFLWQFAALRAARELSRKLRFQLAHHVTYASIHVPSQLWRLGIPVVFGPIGGGQTTPDGMLSYFGASKSRELLRSAVTRSLTISPLHREWLQQMSVVLAANSDTLNLVRRSGCKNASLMCDTAIPADYFAEAPRKVREVKRAVKLLWVGRMLSRKALPLALDAMKEVHHNVTLTIAGDGIAPEVVHRMIRERNLEQRVFWKGTRLTFQELRAAYAEHDAMLFTSLRDSFGSQLLEAMAMGLPIITVDLHGAHDFVPQGASFKVTVSSPENTVSGLASAIEEFACLPAGKRNRMSEFALSFAKTLSWPARAESAERLYDKVLSRTMASAGIPTSRVAAGII